MLKALINVQIYDYHCYYENGYIIFDEVVREVGDMKSFKNKLYHVIDGKGKLVMPNFVCAHSHIYSIFARGLSLPFHPKNFQEILDQMWWKLDSQIDNNITYYSGIAAGSEFLLNGVTTIIDHHASGTDIRGSLTALKNALANVVKVRSILCFETSDRFNLHDCIEENLAFANTHHSHFVSGLFGMHASMSLSDASMKVISRKIDGVPIHIHVAESKMDVQDCESKYKTTIIKRLAKYELISPDSLIVHGVFTTPEELEIVRESGAYMVVNPTSNLNNAVGVSDVKQFLKSGCKVMVGNDGLSSSMATEYLNTYYLAHLKNKSPIAMNLKDIVDIINNAYEYVGRRLDIKIGKIEANYVSDFMLVDYKPFTEINDANAFGHIFFGLFPNFKPIDVYVNGHRLVKAGKLTSRKNIKEFNKARAYADTLWKRVKE